MINEHTNIAGIYELPMRIIEFETGVKKDELEKIFERLQGKVIYRLGWVYVCNFEKHQRARGNPNIAKGIEKIKKEIPEEIKLAFCLIEPKIDSLPKPIDTLSRSPNNLDRDMDLDRDIDLDIDLDIISEPSSQTLNQLLGLFQPINPVMDFGNKTQRSAMQFVVDKVGWEKAEKIIQFALSVQGEQYAPVVTTPIQLKNKLAQVGVYWQKQNNNQPLTAEI